MKNVSQKIICRRGKYSEPARTELAYKPTGRPRGRPEAGSLAFTVEQIKNMPDLLSMRQLAFFLNVTSGTVRQWVRAAKNPLPYRHDKWPPPHGTFVCYRDEIVNWLKETGRLQ